MYKLSASGNFSSTLAAYHERQTMTQSVGVIGLGDMGLAMARNLLAAGFTTYGCDLREERLALLEAAGGRRAESLAHLAQRADPIFVMVLNGAQARQVICGADGLCHTLPKGATLIITATVEPRELRELADELQNSGVHLIDCPVSGGQFGAEAGTLTLMAAAPTAVLDAQREVLAAISARLIHVGETPGQGQTVKAALQAFIGVSYVGIFEALALGTAAGVPGHTLVDVIGSTHAGNTSFFRAVTQHILAREFDHTGSHIGTMVKDLGISQSLGRECSVPLFTTAAAAELFRAAIARYPQEDNQCIIKLLEEVSGVELRP
ncbi:MAG: NAD(P)-dependent oxidoreductase [Anaerolineaceae bacterium]|nr:NAD(P)-dependent oxidoreductase [Anaerolineaceae bacterium]